MEENKETETVQTETMPEKSPEQAVKTYSEQEYNTLKSQLDTAKNNAMDYKQKWEQSKNDPRLLNTKPKSEVM